MVIRQGFYLSKQFQKARFMLQDISRFLGLCLQRKKKHLQLSYRSLIFIFFFKMKEDRHMTKLKRKTKRAAD